MTHTVEPLLSRRDGFDVTSDKIWGRYRQLSLGGPGYHAIYKQRSQINRVTVTSDEPVLLSNIEVTQLNVIKTTAKCNAT